VLETAITTMVAMTAAGVIDRFRRSA